jgi:hypothetical protein
MSISFRTLVKVCGFIKTMKNQQCIAINESCSGSSYASTLVYYRYISNGRDLEKIHSPNQPIDSTIDLNAER